MVTLAVSWTAYHLLLPVTLVASVIFRYNVLSSVYLILLLVFPYLPSLTHTTKGKCGGFAMVLLIISTLFVLSHMGFQIAMLATQPYGSLLGSNCSSSEMVARYVGFERLDTMDVGNVFRVLLPDILCFVVATLTYVLIKKTTEYTPAPQSDNRQREQVTSESYNNIEKIDSVSQESAKSSIPILRVTSTRLKNAALLFVTIIMLGLAGIMDPSAFSALYLFMFLVLMTTWSFHGRLLVPAVAVLRILLSVVAAVQLLLLFYYQMDFFRVALPVDGLAARLMGLTPFLITTCSDQSYKLLLTPNLSWFKFVSPPIIFILYWILALGVRTFYSSDMNKIGPRAGQSISRRRNRARDEKTVRSSKDDARSYLQPLVSDEVVPHNYDAVDVPSTSRAENGVEPDDENDAKYSAPVVKQGYLHVISDWISGLKNQSFYVFILIIMMAWSVTFHSWLTLIFLVWSCILWMVKDKAWSTLCCSPFITIYAMLLICLKFIYSLNLTESELPTSVNNGNNKTMNLSSFGIEHYYNSNPSLLLGAQILYTCVYWIVLHQFVYIRRNRNLKQEKKEGELSWIVKASLYVKEKLSKYWILLVYSFLMIMSFEGTPSGIKMIYALCLSLSFFVYEISWALWRHTLYLFLLVLIVYSMVVVLLVYTFQFDEFPGYWKSFTNFTDQQLADLGLIKYENAGELLLRIFIPTIFLLCAILQMHYFHDRFMLVTTKHVRTQELSSTTSDSNSINEGGTVESIEMVDLGKEEDDLEETTKKELVIMCAKKGGEILMQYWYGLIRLVWRVLEFHVWKLLIIAVLVSALQRATAIYGLLFASWVLLMPIKSGRNILYVITCGYCSLILLASMFYQLEFITHLRGNDLDYNCSFQLNSTTWSKEYDLLEWIGFTKMPDYGSFFYHAQGYITILIMLALERTVVRRQDWRRHYRSEIKMNSQLTALYPSVKWKQADDSFLLCGKFLLNHWFYLFGVEACYVMAVITMWSRSDIYGVLYSVFFIISMCIKTRRSLAWYWRFYTFVLLLILIGEYGVALGMPPSWCVDDEYPWTTLTYASEVLRDRLVRWLYLPDYMVPPYSTSLIVDVFQLLFIVSQLFVFYFERSEIALQHGGDNKYLTPQQLDDVTPATNQRPNFMLKKSSEGEAKYIWSRNILDQVKVLIFKYSFWVTTAIIFIAGTTRISLYCLGYLIAFFYLLSFNEPLLVGKASRLLRIWNLVLAYNVAVIVLKVALQLASCVYINILEDKACVFVQLMSFVCAKPSQYRGLAESIGENSCATPLSYTNAGLTWDFVCFLFLIIQRRTFTSYYFRHIAEDLRTSLKLASRGAELFEEMLVCEVDARKAEEEKEIMLVQVSMQTITKKYANISSDKLDNLIHTDAMLAGDYYMFEEDDERESSDKGEKDILNPLQMINVADTEGIDKALEGRQGDKKLLREGEDQKPVPTQTLSGVTTGESTDDAVLSDSADEVEEEIKRSAIAKFFLFLWELLMSGIDTLTLWLNTINCDYRNVALQLSTEKDELTMQNVEETSPRGESSITIDPGDETRVIEEHVKENESTQSDQSTSNETQQQMRKSDLTPIDFDKDQMRLIRLFYAVWYTIISRTDVVCYMLVILNLMLSASVMSLVLPIAIFLWAALSTPRPTTRFWNFCILYMEIIIVIKFVFQFEFFPWNKDAQSNLEINNPFWWPRIIGVEQKSNWSAFDLAQLLAFFFHRSILKVHGLWDKSPKRSKSQLNSGEEGSEENGKTTEGTAKAIKEQNEDHTLEADNDGNVKEVTDDQEQSDEEGKRTKKQKLMRAASSPFRFYKRVVVQEISSVTDVYVFIFLCDVINFIIIIFGYWAFGKYVTEADNVVSNISSNRVPTGFLAMLLIQFSMMFIDRALYLRRNIIGKLLFQFILVIGVHVWMFFILPAINERPFYMNGVAQTWYFFKAIYFLLSAYQIRCGYPTRVLGNFLTKSYGTANLFLFKGYRLIPFLAELTAIMDWMFVDTSMGIGEWFKFQSIYAEVFELKCWRVFSANYPGPRATAKSKLVKYLVGGLLVFFLIAIIWFPLLFMNIVLTIAGVANNPTEVSVQISVGTFEPMFRVVVDSDSITTWTDEKFNKFSAERASNSTAALFLSSYSASQVVSVNIVGEAKTVWDISPPQKAKFLNRLSVTNPNSVQLDFEWSIRRNPEVSSVVMASGINRVFLATGNKARQELYEMLNNSTAQPFAIIPGIFPRYVYSGPKALSTAANKLFTNESGYDTLNMTLSRSSATGSEWWSVSDLANRTSQSSFTMDVFSDKVSPASLNFLVGYGIIGLYVSIVLVVGRVVRGALAGSTSTIMFNELPRVDRVLQLCKDIYMVRGQCQFRLEEDLYAKLIFLYRSPQLLIQWCRPKQD